MFIANGRQAFMKLAVSGKGGVGKTTIAAALIKSFAQTCRLVYAIDCDPDACLAAAIGIPEDAAMKIKPVAEMKELIQEKIGSGAFYVLNPRVDDIVESYAYKHENIRFFRMGEIKQGGTQCYCRESSFIHALVSSLLLDQGEVVVMDMSAGVEHLTRGTAKGVDLMLVVVEPSLNSINTARHVKRLSSDLGIKRVKIIGNKVRLEKEREFIEGSFQVDEILGFIKFDSSSWENGMMLTTVNVGGQLLADVERIKRRILVGR